MANFTKCSWLKSKWWNGGEKMCVVVRGVKKVMEWQSPSFTTLRLTLQHNFIHCIHPNTNPNLFIIIVIVITSSSSSSRSSSSTIKDSPHLHTAYWYCWSCSRVDTRTGRNPAGSHNYGPRTPSGGSYTRQCLKQGCWEVESVQG